MEHNMKNLELQQMRKEKLLQRLESLSPQSRIAILGAAMELKQLRKLKLDRK
jgi:predicted RNase H-like nuclease (RuvC/YqgF family)